MAIEQIGDPDPPAPARPLRGQRCPHDGDLVGFAIEARIETETGIACVGRACADSKMPSLCLKRTCHIEVTGQIGHYRQTGVIEETCRCRDVETCMLQQAAKADCPAAQGRPGQRYIDPAVRCIAGIAGGDQAVGVEIIRLDMLPPRMEDIGVQAECVSRG